MRVDINLKLLRTFDAVARHESFTRAAAELGRTQSTVSNQVRDLENQLGVQLLDRTSRQIALTKEGEALAGPLRGGIQSILEGLGAVRTLGDDRRGRVLIGCVPSLSSILLPSILATYRTRDKLTRIDVEELTSTEIVAAMSNAEFDFGIGPCSDPAPLGIAFAVAVDDPLIVLLQRSDACGIQGAVTFDTLASLPLITLSGSVLLQRQLEGAAASYGARLQSRTEVRHVHTAIAMARAGVGAAIVPRLALPDVLDSEIVALQIMEPPLTRKVGIITRHGTLLRPEASRLTRYVQSALARRVQNKRG